MKPMSYKSDANIVAELKLAELKRLSPRSRVGNAVPLNKSKAANRAKAKAARKARKK